MERKKRDREDLTSLYAKERVRLAALIAANDAMFSAGQSKAVSVTATAPIRK